MLIFSLTSMESQKEPSRFFLFSWFTIDGCKKLKFYNNKNFLCSYNGAYDPFIENKGFLQLNKNFIPFMGCITQSRE